MCAICDGFANESFDLNAVFKTQSLVSTVSGRACTGTAVIVLFARKPNNIKCFLCFSL